MRGFNLLKWLLFLLIIFKAGDSFAQNQIWVKGIVTDAVDGYTLPGLMVVNKRTHTGLFGNSAGEFTINIFRDDTIKLSVVGYQTLEICFIDSSVVMNNFYIELKLEKLRFDLHEMEVFSHREFKEIKKDMEKLGVDYKYQTSGIAGAFYHPVSFFYERFSRYENQKRKAADLQNQENQKDLLKELFSKYIQADFIDLSVKEFDDFIDFCRFSEFFIKNASQYDLTLAVKLKFEEFKRLKK
jgi:hypothetical protein